MLKRILLIALLLLSLSPAAMAESAYRYWGYFQAPSGANSWTAAMTGPSIEVKDGDVEGWAFTASSNDIPATAPMMDPDFLSLCGDLPEVSGKIRVGLVVDFGGAEIAPTGEVPREFFSDCVSVPEGSVGADVLTAALEIRSDGSGLICGIAGYPNTECGAEIDSTQLVQPIADIAPLGQSAEPGESTSDKTGALALGILGMIAVAALFARVRKSKQS